jgi:tetratricopeptide (TPR) repeat protein
MDIALSAVVAVLVLAILALAGLFAYQVYLDRQRAAESGAATRVIIALEKEVRKNPNDAALRVRMGEAYGAAKRFKEAVEQFNAALQIDPKHHGAYLDLGLVAMLTDEDTKAKRYFEKVIEITDTSQYSNLDPRREHAFYNLGVLALQANEYSDAAGYFKGALRIRKDASDTYLQLARALRGLGDLDAAINNAEIALAFDPGYAEAHFLLGQIYAERKDDVNASYHYQRSAEEAPDADPPREALQAMGSVEDWVAKAETREKSGDLQGAVEALLVARNIDPKLVNTVIMHGDLLVKMGKNKDAVDVYGEALKLSPDNKDIQAKLKAAKSGSKKD